MKLHAALARALGEVGVGELFGVMGDANLFLVDAYVRGGHGRYVAAAHEANAILMAYGCANRSGRLGAATVTHGPGLLNGVNALVEASRSRTPVLVVAGDTPADQPDHLQNIPQRELVVATGAGLEEVAAPGAAVPALVRAARRAVVERRPVVLSVPVELMWEEVDGAVPAPVPTEPSPAAPDPGALDRALGAIASSRRPVVLVGRGVPPGARPTLEELGDRLGAALATTLRASSFFRGAPYDIGVFGTLSTPTAGEVIAASDCVVAFGASLNRWTTMDGSLLAGRAVVHCDADLAALGHHVDATVAVHGDAALTAGAMVELLAQADHRPGPLRSPELADSLRAERSARPVAPPEEVARPGTVPFTTALCRLEELLPSDRTVVLDGGRFVVEALARLTVPEPRALLPTFSFGSIGHGVAAGVGAHHGRTGGGPVVVVTGDGGLVMGGLNELHTAVRDELDLIVVVCNDGAYGAEHVQFTDRGMDPTAALLAGPDLARVATAMGLVAVTVAAVDDLDRVAEAVEGGRRPLLVDLRLDPTAVPYPRH